jgi:hypothetical protein
VINEKWYGCSVKERTIIHQRQRNSIYVYAKERKVNKIVNEEKPTYIQNEIPLCLISSTRQNSLNISTYLRAS